MQFCCASNADTNNVKIVKIKINFSIKIISIKSYFFLKITKKRITLFGKKITT